ncbi:MAG: tryptophan 2,3-dioxygenase, partial [Gammaproteobacteria bacterium]|nr:tryptophan 2,3-dioxygenase [Gammaproteobacteria bacterium]
MSGDEQRPASAVDLSDQAIHWDADLSYGGYLRLDGLLSLQRPVSVAH